MLLKMGKGAVDVRDGSPTKGTKLITLTRYSHFTMAIHNHTVGAHCSH